MPTCNGRQCLQGQRSPTDGGYTRLSERQISASVRLSHWDRQAE